MTSISMNKKCINSGKKMHVSDYDIMNESTRCDVCKKKVRFKIPDKKNRGNYITICNHKSE
jgi:phage/plasmid primase-like uncharacterized protein